MAGLPAILGPTATGKTALAIELAQRMSGEIVSLDSRQAYSGLAVGTAAPSASERAAAVHHGVGFLPPGSRYGAGNFARRARRWIGEIEGRRNVPLLVGGSGLFYRALTRPIFREPELDPDRRRALEEWLEGRSLEDLRDWTATLDPGRERQLTVLDRHRCLRAIEMALLTGRPLTWWHEHGRPEAPPVVASPVVLVLPADEHRARIRRRADSALDAGWAEEVRALRDAGHDRDSPAFSSIGYAAVDDWVAGTVSREDTLTRIVRDTWAYARRQRTWFRHQLSGAVVRHDARRPAGELADEIYRYHSDGSEAVDGGTA